MRRGIKRLMRLQQSCRCSYRILGFAAPYEVVRIGVLPRSEERGARNEGRGALVVCCRENSEGRHGAGHRRQVRPFSTPRCCPPLKPRKVRIAAFR